MDESFKVVACTGRRRVGDWVVRHVPNICSLVAKRIRRHLNVRGGFVAWRPTFCKPLDRKNIAIHSLVGRKMHLVMIKL